MDRLRPSRSQLFDIALALALAVIGWWEVLADPLAEDVVGGPVWLNLLAVAGMTLPLAWRRRAPFWVAMTVYAVLAGRALAAEPLELYPTFLAVLIATYTVASYAPLRDALLSAAFSGLAISVAVVEGSGTDAAPDPLASAILFGTVWLIGRVVGVRNERAMRLHDAREQHAQEAVAAERDRIARELHDVVSHSLAAIVMQAGGARNVFDDDPERTRESLRSIEDNARRGLAEMRRLLGLFGEQADLGPQPGVAEIGDLVAEVRRAGLDVELEISGIDQALSPGVDVSAYRIVQEALTNVMKHAGRCRAWVVVRADGEWVDLEVSDDGAGAGAGNVSPGDGRGLLGMRERAEVLGGTVETGADEAGFRVRARLPL